MTSAGKTIVVVEDDPAIAELVQETLEADPAYSLIVVSDGAAAIPTIREARPCLVLLDVILPNITGLEIYDLLAADPDTSSIPVLFLTINYDEPTFRARRLTNWLAKPFDTDYLLERVREACS